MSHYKSNIRDIEFNLFEVLGRDQVLGHGPFEEVDVETAKSILGEDLARGLAIHLGERPGAQDLVPAQDLEEVELDVAEVALVVAHVPTCSHRCGPSGFRTPCPEYGYSSVTS